MDEELAKILSDGELDNEAKTSAIKDLVGKTFVPTVKYNTEKQNTQAQKEAYNVLKEEFEAFKQSKMTDEEKQAEALKIEREKAQKNNERLSKLLAENIFAKAGFAQEDYQDIIPAIIQENIEKTETFAQTICSTMLKQKENIENKVKESIIKNQKKPEGGNYNVEGLTDLEKLEQTYAEAVKSNDKVAMAKTIRLITEIKSRG